MNTHLSHTSPAFTTPTPLTLSPSRLQISSQICPRQRRMQMKISPNSSEDITPFNPLPTNKSKPPTSGVWPTMRRIFRASAISAAMLFGPTLLPPKSLPSNRAGTPVAIAATKTQKTDSHSTSDVEAAAMTLGAVTIGAILMRTVVHSRRDEEAEKARVAAECERLAKEEEERARRIKRKKMEAVDIQSNSPDGVLNMDDGDIMSALKKRVQTLEDGTDQDQDEQDNEDDQDTHMRHAPIPDRGMGSAVLDRPDDEDDEETPNDENEEKLAKPDELEMLNRMWNLSSPDKE